MSPRLFYQLFCMQNLKICCVGRFTFRLRRQCTTLHSYYWHKTWWCLWNVQFSSMNSPDFFVKCQVDFSSRLFNSLSLKFSRIFYMANETNFFYYQWKNPLFEWLLNWQKILLFFHFILFLFIRFVFVLRCRGWILLWTPPSLILSILTFEDIQDKWQIVQLRKTIKKRAVWNKNFFFIEGKIEEKKVSSFLNANIFARLFYFDFLGMQVSKSWQ